MGGEPKTRQGIETKYHNRKSMLVTTLVERTDFGSVSLSIEEQEHLPTLLQ